MIPVGWLGTSQITSTSCPSRASPSAKASARTRGAVTSGTKYWLKKRIRIAPI
jgi:hypothetical protein